MEREKLDAYISMKDEIDELKQKIEQLPEKLTDVDVILDYRTGYPIPQSIVSVDEKRYWALRKKYEERIKKLQTECREVEELIEGIEDSLTRRIFRMYYMDGMTLFQIGKNVHLDKSNVSRRIYNFLKVATHATNAML